MASNQTLRALYQMGLFTLFTSVLWATLTVYHSLTKPPDVHVDEATLAPLQANLDLDFLEGLASREQLSNQVDALLASQVANPFEEPTPEPSPSPSSNLPASPSSETSPATGSGSSQ